MTLHSSAQLRPLAKQRATRIRALVSELKEHHQCLVKYGDDHLEMSFDDNAMRWICLGHLERIFKRYEDIVQWQGEFVQDDSQKDRRKVKRNHVLPAPETMAE